MHPPTATESGISVCGNWGVGYQGEWVGWRNHIRTKTHSVLLVCTVHDGDLVGTTGRTWST